MVERESRIANAGFLADDQAISPAIRSPSFFETVKSDPICTNPPSLYLPNAASPAEAKHPHSVQTGFPPNWQGVMGVVKSDDTQLVVCAKMQASGELGGSW
jgi:hypothetical protein